MDINATFIVELVIFSVFYLFVKRSLWPLFAGILEERQSLIRDGLASAEEGRLFLEKAQKEADKILTEARAKSHQIVEQTEKELEVLENEHKREIENLRLEGQKELLAEKDRIMALFFKQAQIHYFSVIQSLLSKVLNSDKTAVHQALEKALSDSFSDKR